MIDVEGVGDALHVVVAVLTFQRLESLARLLPQLGGQAIKLDANLPCSTRILVVDNDPTGSARLTVEGSDGRVSYAHEPVPGIAAARARAVEEARNADVVVFIDDDEEPSPGWLVAMVGTWRSHGRPAGVVGRVSAVQPADVDPWITAGGFFTRRSYTTGTRVSAASSANLLLDIACLRRLQLSFDARLGLRGGEDTLLTRSLTERGEELVWCNEAEVIDLVEPSRLNRRWVLKRAYSHGVVASRVDLALSRYPWQTRPRLVIGSTARIAAGLVQAAAGVLTGQLAHRARGWRMIFRGAGRLAGSLGRDVVEYRRA